MVKLLTNREMELFRVALNLEEAVDRANPEVGMGPSRKMLAERLANRLTFIIDEDDIAEICEHITGQ